MFKVGDRVECVKTNTFAEPGETGTVINATLEGIQLVEWDNNVGGHDGAPGGEVRGKDGYCEWTNPEFIKPLSSKIYEIDLTPGKKYRDPRGHVRTTDDDGLYVRNNGSKIRINDMYTLRTMLDMELLPVPAFSEDEKTILKNIDKKYKYIARDNCGLVIIYTHKPFKNFGNWDCKGLDYDYSVLNIFPDLFKSISAEDVKPALISDILED